MDRQDFWKVIEDARRATGGEDTEAVAAHAVAGLAALPAERIVGAAQTLWGVMGDSYRGDLWAAAYIINSGASDDGFDYFRGWLMAQGREAYERAVADPDSLADLPAVRAAAPDESELECEEMLSIVWNAHLEATGEELPPDAFTIRHPAIEDDWDFDDVDEVRTHLPRLTRLYEV